MMLAAIEKLFAESSPLSDMGSRFQNSADKSRIGQLLILVGVLIAVGVVVAYVARRYTRNQRRGYTSPRALFYELCEAHKLTRSQRKLLRQVSRFLRLRQPALLFVEPDCFDTNRLSELIKERSDELAQLHEKLFGN